MQIPSIPQLSRTTSQTSKQQNSSRITQVSPSQTPQTSADTYQIVDNNEEVIEEHIIPEEPQINEPTPLSPGEIIENELKLPLTDNGEKMEMKGGSLQGSDYNTYLWAQQAYNQSLETIRSDIIRYRIQLGDTDPNSARAGQLRSELAVKNHVFSRRGGTLTSELISATPINPYEKEQNRTIHERKQKEAQQSALKAAQIKSKYKDTDWTEPSKEGKKTKSKSETLSPNTNADTTSIPTSEGTILPLASPSTTKQETYKEKYLDYIKQPLVPNVQAQEDTTQQRKIKIIPYTKEKLKQEVKLIKEIPGKVKAEYKEKGAQKYFSEIGMVFVNTPISIIKGTGKLVKHQFYDPVNEVYIVATELQKGKEIKQVKLEYSKRQLAFIADKDVQTATFIPATVLLGAASPVLGTAVAVGATAYQTQRTIKEPTTTHIGELATVAALSKGYSKSKTPDIPKGFLKEYKAYELASSGFKNTQRQINNIDISRSENIPKKAIKPIEQVLSTEDSAIVGGSLALEAGGVKLTRKPRDIDLYAPETNIPQIRNKLLKTLKENNIPHQLIGKNIHFGEKEGISFHTTNALFETLATVKRKYTPTGLYIYKTPQGINIVDPNLIAQRKYIGGFEKPTKSQIKEMKEDPALLKESANLQFYRYSKDIPAFVKSSKEFLKEESSRAQNYPAPIRQIKQYKTARGKQALKPYLKKGTVEKEIPTEEYFQGKPASRIEALKQIDAKLFPGKRGQLTKQREYTKPYRILKEPTHRISAYYSEQQPKETQSSFSQSNYQRPYVYNQLTNYPQKPYTPISNYQTKQTYPRSNQKNKQKYLPYTPPTTYTEYPVFPPTTKTRSTILLKKTRQTQTQAKTRKEELRKVRAYKPVLFTQDGQYSIGEPYATYQDAVEEGMITVDNTPFNRFTIKSIAVNPFEIRRGRQYNQGHKFQKKGDTYLEKRYYRFDKRKERQGNFNWFPYVFRKGEYA